MVTVINPVSDTTILDSVQGEPTSPAVDTAPGSNPTDTDSYETAPGSSPTAESREAIGGQPVSRFSDDFRDAISKPKLRQSEMRDAIEDELNQAVDRYQNDLARADSKVEWSVTFSENNGLWQSISIESPHLSEQQEKFIANYLRAQVLRHYTVGSSGNGVDPNAQFTIEGQILFEKPN